MYAVFSASKTAASKLYAAPYSFGRYHKRKVVIALTNAAAEPARIKLRLDLIH